MAYSNAHQQKSCASLLKSINNATLCNWHKQNTDRITSGSQIKSQSKVNTVCRKLINNRHPTQTNVWVPNGTPTKSTFQKLNFVVATEPPSTHEHLLPNRSVHTPMERFAIHCCQLTSFTQVNNESYSQIHKNSEIEISPQFYHSKALKSLNTP